MAVGVLTLVLARTPTTLAGQAPRLLFEKGEIKAKDECPGLGKCIPTFGAPEAIELDSAGNIWVADTTIHRIRQLVQPELSF
jgi:hypothetical protein